MKKGKCCFCKSEYDNFGNNAQPLKNGRCCNWCNNNMVVPLRIRIYTLKK